MFRRIINTTVSWPGMHSNPIRPSALASLALASIYILSPYVSIYSLASYFIYYTHINIASVSILTLSIYQHHDIINTSSASALIWTTYSSVPIIDSFLDLLIYLLYLYKLSMLILIAKSWNIKLTLILIVRL